MRPFCLLASLTIFMILGLSVPSPGALVAEEAAGGDTIMVVGASGRSGRFIIERLRVGGYSYRSMTTNKARATETFSPEHNWVEADVKDVNSLESALAGTTRIISALGATKFEGPNRPETVDYLGVVNMVDAAKAAGVKQIVLISAIGAEDEDNTLNSYGNVLHWKFKGENYLRASGIGFTIIRPGGLTDEPGGEVGVRMEQRRVLGYMAGKISRDDVAEMCIEALRNPDAWNKTVEVVSDSERDLDAWRSEFAAIPAD
jgi:uncharacterized protein YbjT (DUF2867 family)